MQQLLVRQDLSDVPFDATANARRVIRFGIRAIIGGVLAFVIWSWLVPLSSAVIAEGVVKVDLNRKTIQHLEGGIVRAIHVRDGDRVAAGQLLVTLEDLKVDASLEQLKLQADSERAKLARLNAERDLAARPAFPEDLQKRRDKARVAELLQRETALFAARRQALDSQVRLLAEQARAAEQEIASLEAQVKDGNTSIGLMDEETAANERLAQQGFISKSRLLGLQRNVSDYRVRQGGQAAELAKARQKKSDLELRMATLRANYVQTASDELKEATARIFAIEEQLRPTQDARARQQILAPVAGEVVDIKVNTVGASVGPREPLMDIVPVDTPLIIEARVGPDGINDVHPGAEADIQLTAFKRRTTPMVTGKVSYVSADRLVDRANGVPYYVAHILVPPEALREAGDLKLHPGMAAEVFVRAEERTTLDYLLAPITDTLRRAMRER
ncbi:MAG: HlyD family type I secretion periplasmic adaptor subunit [Betaproteobacteria bacterium]|nr:HlyD family type I secretion periplasmic adaptor subunit [Betaproteobacteria bacterium]